ncbi:MAG: DNA repair protein RecN (Recombination protein N) [Phenylobacterium sp.]|jgi:DNA repair protein RecN (Recombination protein N)
MLSHLQIRSLAIVKSLEIDWSPGMTAITGETGAGKSIAIDALSLVIGERAEAAMVRPGSDKAEVIATFDISQQPTVQQWLSDKELSSECNGEGNGQSDCIVRRVISKEGRSKAYINGTTVPLQQVKQLGEQLVSIHGQHAHQLLAKPEYQQQLLDLYADHTDLLAAVKKQYQHCHAIEKEFEQLSSEQSIRDSQKQLLEYQVSELDEFALQPGEFTQIEDEHKTLSHGQDLLSQSQSYLDNLYESSGHTAHGLVSDAAHNFSELAQIDAKLQPIADLLYESAVQIEEASHDIRHYCDNLSLDPARLIEVEERLTKALTLARKHQVGPTLLAEHHNTLSQQLNHLNDQDSRLGNLEADIAAAKEKYLKQAKKLSTSRGKAAKTLNQLISQSMRGLNMPDGLFKAALNPGGHLSASGTDKIEFLVTANPGQPLQPLHKVASGGELARISLAIQVIIANTSTIPTLIFDEVDVGISGPTAASVANLLRSLGQTTQVICVTHLPQVASKGHQQLFVEKSISNRKTETSIRRLNDTDRIDEIARLLGGSNITATTKANASELLLN